MCVRGREAVERQTNMSESAHLSLTSKYKKRKKTKGALSKRNKKKMKNVSVTSTRRSKHTKKECPRYVAWHVKKGKSLAEVNLAVTYHSHLFACLVIFFN